MGTLTKKTLKISLLLFTVSLLTACSGKNNDSEYNIFKRSLLQNDNSSIDSAVNANPSLAYCNKINSQVFQGNLELYFNNNGAFHNDAIRIRLKATPVDFSSADSSIKFYQWKADSTTSQLDEEAMNFYFENNQTGDPISGIMTEFNASDVNLIANGTSLSSFLQSTNIVITGIANDSNAMKLVFYKNTNFRSEANFLIPAFDNNPNTYASTHPQVLSNLHPHNGISSLTESQYASLNKGLCI